jgi:SAM-dependent methyltransferase
MPLPVLNTLESCRICHGSRTRCIGQKTSSFSEMTFRLFECRDCSFQFVRPVVDPASLYTADYYRGRGADHIVNYEEEYRNPFHTPRIFEFNNLMQIVREFKAETTSQQLRWLDYGCGNGALLRFLTEQKDLQVQAAGFDESAFSHHLKDQGFEFYDRNELQTLPPAIFDVISCIEVIEHTLEPQEVVAEISRLLKPRGLLLLTTGNMHSPLARVTGFRFSYCVPEVHISLFNPRLLENVYRAYGLEPCYFRYSGVIRFKILKSLGPRLGKNKIASFVAGLRPVTRILDWLFGVSKIPCAVKMPQVERSRAGCGSEAPAGSRHAAPTAAASQCSGRPGCQPHGLS